MAVPNVWGGAHWEGVASQIYLAEVCVTWLAAVLTLF